MVLLILAGVSISTLTGENGIITNAKKALKEQKDAELREAVKMTIAELKIEYYKSGESVSFEDFIKAKIEENEGKIELPNGDSIYIEDDEIRYKDKDENVVILKPNTNGDVVIDKIITSDGSEKENIPTAFQIQMSGSDTRTIETVLDELYSRLGG